WRGKPPCHGPCSTPASARSSAGLRSGTSPSGGCTSQRTSWRRPISASALSPAGLATMLRKPSAAHSSAHTASRQACGVPLTCCADATTLGASVRHTGVSIMASAATPGDSGSGNQRPPPVRWRSAPPADAPGTRMSQRTDTPRVMDAFRPLLIAGLVVTEVAIWQWRMVIAHRGSRVSAMLLGIVGAVLQITAITQVVADVSDPAGIIAYAVGVGFGVLLGLVAGERLTPGMIGVTIV